MNPGKLILILCAGAITGWADNNSAVRGPVSGFVFDVQARVIRPMLGIPGASYMGGPVVSKVDAASISPDGSAAIATAAGKLVVYTGLGNASATALPVKAAIAADRFAWAPGSNAAALYSSQTAQAQILTSLLTAPSAGAPIDLSGISGRIAAMAFDGEQIVLAVASNDAGGIYSVTASGTQRLASAVNPSAIALAGADLYFADQQAQKIWQVQSYARQPVPMLFAGDATIAAPVGLQLSADGKRLYLADAGSHTLGVYDVAARSRTESLALNFTPTMLDRFGDSSVFQMDTASQAQVPLHVLSDGAGKRAIYFVPAVAGGGQRHPIRYHPVANP